MLLLDIQYYFEWQIIGYEQRTTYGSGCYNLLLGRLDYKLIDLPASISLEWYQKKLNEDNCYTLTQQYQQMKTKRNEIIPRAVFLQRRFYPHVAFVHTTGTWCDQTKKEVLSIITACSWCIVLQHTLHRDMDWCLSHSPDVTDRYASIEMRTPNIMPWYEVGLEVTQHQGADLCTGSGCASVFITHLSNRNLFLSAKSK